jgi:hypothetical protein
MARVQLATRIDQRIKAAVEGYCEARGLKMTRFIEDALLDKLEEIEDLEEIKRLRTEPTRPIEEIVRDLKLDGLL